MSYYKDIDNEIYPEWEEILPGTEGIVSQFEREYPHHRSDKYYYLHTNMKMLKVELIKFGLFLDFYHSINFGNNKIKFYGIVRNPYGKLQFIPGQGYIIPEIKRDLFYKNPPVIIPKQKLPIKTDEELIAKYMIEQSLNKYQTKYQILSSAQYLSRTISVTGSYRR